MKRKIKLNLYLLAILSFFGLISCEENVIGDFDSNTNSSKVEDEDLSKKGAAFSYNKERWSHKTSEVNAHWLYTWGNQPREEIPDKVEYIPMFWGKGSVNQENLGRISQLIAEGKVNYVLGFNEPDGAAQANMSVDEAIELWPQIESLGVPIGSPATVDPLNNWMKEFMRRANELNYRVDFIALHHYGGPRAESFINKLKRTYEEYNLPIWITEFAVADWNATSPENNRHSEAEVMDFMSKVLPALDQIEWIERYSWFDGLQAPLRTSALYDEDNNLTSVGQFYANHTPNPNIGPGTDTEFKPIDDPDNLFVNAGFESGQIEPWGGFKNGVLTSEATEPLTGNFVGRIENNDGSLFYELSLEPGKTYEFTYNTKWGETPGSTITAKIRNQTAGEVLFDTPELSTSTEWQEGSLEFTLPDSVSSDDTVRIVFYKPQRNPPLPPLFFDDMSLKLVE